MPYLINDKSGANGAQIQRILFLGLFLFLFVISAILFSPFLSIILWAGVLYVLTFPLFHRLVRRPDGRPVPAFIKTLIAGIMSILCLMIVVLPVFFIGVNVIGQIRGFIQTIMQFVDTNKHLLQSPGGPQIIENVRNFSGGLIDLGTIDLKMELYSVLQRSSSQIFSISSLLVRNLMTLVFSLAFLVFSLFFFYMDGDHLMHVLMDAMPIDRAYTIRFLKRFRDTARHLVRGYVLVALYQGLAGYLIFNLFSVPSPLFLAVLVSLTSFVPMVGTALIWAPIGLAKLASGDVMGGIAILACCGFFISILDNFIRPLLIHGRVSIHPLLIFFSILGGVRFFGLNGILIGPMIIILFFTAVELFQEAFGSRKHDEPAQSSH